MNCTMQGSAPPPGGGGYCHMGYLCMCLCEGYCFQAVYSGIGYNYKSESLGLEQGIIFQEADQLVEDFSLD